MKTKYKNYSWHILFILACTLFLPLLAFGQTNAAPPGETVAPPKLTFDPSQLGLAVVVPLVIWGFRSIAPRIPGAVWPVLAPGLAWLIDLLAQMTGIYQSNPYLALLLGSAGVGVRELTHEVNKWRNGAAVAAILLCLPFATGCVSVPKVTQIGTTTNGVPIYQTNVVKELSPAARSIIVNTAGDTAEVGTRLAILRHPDWRQYFEMAVMELQGLSNAGSVDVAAFTNVVGKLLAKLDVKELQGETGMIVMSGGLSIVNLANGIIAEIKMPDLMVQVRAAVLAGMRRGLGTQGTRRDLLQEWRQMVRTEDDWNPRPRLFNP